jgi:glucan phosphoethanolaminetransferase (alkaline phosphatase superfamily)
MKVLRKISAIVPYIGLFIALLLLEMFLQSILDPFYVVNEINYLSLPYDFRGFAKAIVYSLSYMSCTALILIMLMSKSEVLWRFFILSLVVFYSIDLFIQFLSNSRGFTKFEYQLALIEASNFKSIIVYLLDILKAIALSIVVGILLVKLRRSSSRKLSTRWALVFPIPFIMILWSSDKIHSVNTGSFPAPLKIPAIIINHHLTYKEFPPRILDKNIKPKKKPGVKNIFWIIDESVTGSFLSVNGYKKNTTPDLENEVLKGFISNYGVVNSVANCSGRSNLLLRIGLNPYSVEDFENDARKMPTIFQYAKRAGYKTWLYDAQVVKGNLQGHLTQSDMKHIDEYVTLDRTVPPNKRDSVILSRIKQGLEKQGGGNNFVVFIKMGAHWPYLLGYPKGKTIFTPVRKATHEAMVLKNREKTINTYLNLIKFTVNDFLISYMDKISISDSVTFYTSDHGQSIIEKGISRTHCSWENAPSSQADVPLMVINSRAKETFPVYANKIYSQHQIFPATLSLMGYSDSFIKEYGPTLIEGKKTEQKRWFYVSLEGDKQLFSTSPINN